MTALNREWAESKVIQPMVHCEINSYRMRSTTSGRTKPVVAERDIHSTQFYRKRSVQNIVNFIGFATVCSNERSWQ